LERRLRQQQAVCRITRLPREELELEFDEEQLEKVCCALSLLLHKDLVHYELAKAVDRLPLSLVEKQAVLGDALPIAKGLQGLLATERLLRSYVGRGVRLNLYGFIRFRLQETRDGWLQAVERAVQERQLRKEYLSLMDILRGFAGIQPCRMGEVSLCLHEDGSCTLTDPSDARIDYAPCSAERMVSILLGIAPSRLIVYDLSGGRRKTLMDAISRVFAGRVQFYC